MIDYTIKFFHATNNFNIPKNTKFIFVADLFSNEYTGGAELTSEAIMKNRQDVYSIKSNQVTKEFILNNRDKKWILGNISQLDQNIFREIINNLQYFIIEYDYKFCKYRSIEKHLETEKIHCNCVLTHHGKMYVDLFLNAKHIFYMSEEQKQRQLRYIEKLKNIPTTVLSSVFLREDLEYIKTLFEKNNKNKNNKYIVLNSNSWIKGTENAVKYATENNLEYELLGDLRYENFLEKLSLSKGLIYLPNGGDTCPRLVIEGKLLGCSMVLNQNVQHIQESWFNTNDLNAIYNYLLQNVNKFWEIIEGNKKIKLSGYTQTRNCIEQKYPWKECIQSLSGFCDEVVVVDGGSTDGTWEELQTLALLNTKLKIFRNEFNWNDKRFALYDGQLKAISREKCTGDVLWQSDIDEIVHEDDFDKIKNLANNLPTDANLFVLPLIEFWGSKNRLRVDVLPWKWRISRNDLNITHGVPKAHQRFDGEGLMYSAGSDGTDYIYKDTNEPVVVGTFYTDEIEHIRQAALNGDKSSLDKYEKIIQTVMQQFPVVYHYSWFNIERKINTYKNYWSKHWESLFNKKQEDTVENNMFFNKKWKDVSDYDIKKLASKLESEMGGWIFHRKIDFNKKTPFFIFDRKHPKFIREWIKNNS